MIKEEYISTKKEEFNKTGGLTHMKCSVTGIETFCKIAFAKRLEKWDGDLEKMLREWVSPPGQKVLKGLITLEEVLQNQSAPKSKPKASKAKTPKSKKEKVKVEKEPKPKVVKVKKEKVPKVKKVKVAPSSGKEWITNEFGDRVKDYFWRDALYISRKYKEQNTDNEVDLSRPSTAAKEITGSACFRPDYYLDNRRNCLGCPLFWSCSNPLRIIAAQKWEKANKQVLTQESYLQVERGEKSKPKAKKKKVA